MVSHQLGAYLRPGGERAGDLLWLRHFGLLLSSRTQ